MLIPEKYAHSTSRIGENKKHWRYAHPASRKVCRFNEARNHDDLRGVILNGSCCSFRAEDISVVSSSSHGWYSCKEWSTCVLPATSNNSHLAMLPLVTLPCSQQLLSTAGTFTRGFRCLFCLVQTQDAIDRKQVVGLNASLACLMPFKSCLQRFVVNSKYADLHKYSHRVQCFLACMLKYHCLDTPPYCMNNPTHHPNEGWIAIRYESNTGV